MSGPSEPVRARVRAILEQQLAAIESAKLAAEIVQRSRELTNGVSEACRADTVRRAPGAALSSIEAATQVRSVAARLAAVLLETASQSVASTQDAAAVADAAYDVLGAGIHRLPPEAARGRALLRTAAVRRLGPSETVETRLFLALSALPHPAWMHATCEAIGSLATGGWIWSLATLGAYLVRIEGGARALKLVVPIVAMVAFIAEGPAKAFFAPRRPFRHRVQLMFLGAKPRARSFPSGHAATSFAGAWVLGSVWPGRRPMFLALATLVSLSRVYLGAHDLDEILAGSVLGLALAEGLRRPLECVLSPIRLPETRPG